MRKSEHNFGFILEKINSKLPFVVVADGGSRRN